MISFLANHPYIQTLLWFSWLPTLTLWTVFWNTLKNYPRTFTRVIALCLILGIPWDSVAVKAHIWFFPTGCCVEGRFLSLPLEEYLFIFSFALYICTLMMVFRHFYLKRMKFWMKFANLYYFLVTLLFGGVANIRIWYSHQKFLKRHWGKIFAFVLITLPIAMLEAVDLRWGRGHTIPPIICI